MPWLLRLRDKPQTYGSNSNIKPGDCWFEGWLTDPGLTDSYRRSILSRQYLETWDGLRPPLMIALPGESHSGYRLISPDQAYGREPNPTCEGWTVTGTPPVITVSPSILATGDFHDWIQDGVLGEDVEGRLYANLPRTA